jgi:hypothetical protein|tara:strand:- start:402 stop:815 length:414 start_codon:yes stop_codon:yes gene_type:complete
MTEDSLAIPDFLRVFNIRKDVLDEAIKAVSKTGDEELTQRLKNISTPPRFEKIIPEPQVADIPTNKKARLTRKLKEDTVIRICQLIDDGHNTFARLKKASGADDRVLKSAIRHGLAHDIGNLRLTKISAKVYGIRKR